MDSLDLRLAAPRAPRAELAGIIFLPRSIDKIRATLPGGNLGAYQLAGFTQLMLDTLDIPLEAMTQAVAEASSDSDVAAFVSRATTPEKIVAWNDLILVRKPRNGDRNAAYENYPWLRERPDLILALDVLAEDDRLLFTGASTPVREGTAG